MTREPSVVLFRRDALAALAALAAGGGAVAALEADTRREVEEHPFGPGASTGQSQPGRALTGPEVDSLVAIARVVYPSSVAGVDEFVRTFVDHRSDIRPDHARDLSRTLDRLDELARAWHGDPLVALDAAALEQLLREVGADTADPDPAGTIAEQVRYFLVNELLYALYASPTGGELVGIENPQGYPGGIESYRRRPSK